LGFEVVTPNTLHCFSECSRRVKRTHLREARFTLKSPYPGDRSIRTHNFCALPPADLDLSKLKASGLASSFDRQRIQSRTPCNKAFGIGVDSRNDRQRQLFETLSRFSVEPYASGTEANLCTAGKGLHLPMQWGPFRGGWGGGGNHSPPPRWPPFRGGFPPDLCSPGPGVSLLVWFRTTPSSLGGWRLDWRLRESNP
jgi:hypothetical protein